MATVIFFLTLFQPNFFFSLEVAAVYCDVTNMRRALFGSAVFSGYSKRRQEISEKKLIFFQNIRKQATAYFKIT